MNGTALSGFDSDNFNYALSVPYGTTVATVTYEKVSPTATVAVYGGENLVVGANPVTVTVTAQNGEISVYNIVVTRQPESQASIPIATMTGLSSVLAGQSFSVNYGLSNVSSSVYGVVYAQDLTFQFDPNLLEFVAVTSLKNGLVQVSVDKSIAGQVRLIFISQGAGNGISTDGELLKLDWKAKAISQATNASITLSQGLLSNAIAQLTSLAAVTNNLQINVLNKSALISLIAQVQAALNAAVEGNAVGQYPNGSKQVLQTAMNAANTVAANAENQQDIDLGVSSLNEALLTFNNSVIVTIPTIPGDVSGDGKVNVGDLGIVAFNYGKNSSSPDWNSISKADINHDTIIDIADLVAIANAILR